jgi:hypothetical protein
MAVICQCERVVDVDQLLALANGAELHKALLAEVPSAKYRTVARWVGKKRRQPPAEMVGPILRAFGLATDDETAPPKWAERPLALVNLLAEKNGITEEEIAAEADRIAHVADASPLRPERGA